MCNEEAQTDFFEMLIFEVHFRIIFSVVHVHLGIRKSLERAFTCSPRPGGGGGGGGTLVFRGAHTLGIKI